MSLPYLTECDEPWDDTCPRCQERGGMAVTVLAFAVIFALVAGILVGLKIGHPVGMAQAAVR